MHWRWVTGSLPPGLRPAGSRLARLKASCAQAYPTLAAAKGKHSHRLKLGSILPFGNVPEGLLKIAQSRLAHARQPKPSIVRAGRYCGPVDGSITAPGAKAVPIHRDRSPRRERIRKRSLRSKVLDCGSPLPLLLRRPPRARPLSAHCHLDA